MTAPLYKNPNAPIGERLADLLSRMTLEEKVAQMTLLVWPHPSEDKPKPELSPEGFGTLTNLARERPPAEAAEMYNHFQRYLVEQTRLGIPALSIDEALHGCMTVGSTNFPMPLALASAWDPSLVEEVCTVAAREMRAHGGTHALSPVVDLGRDPRWGRIDETFGEDPYLVSRLGVAAVQGLQGRTLPIASDRVIATTKHFGVHGQPEAGSNAGPSHFGEREIREHFLAPFRAAIQEAGAQSVMAAYNEIDGIPTHINRHLLHDLLRDEWGFEGLLVSDGFGLRQLVELHRVAEGKPEAARKALLAGIDFELDSAFPTLVAQVREGRVPMAAIDQAVSRMLRLKFMLGLFEKPFADPVYAEAILNTPAHRALARRAAHKSATLLRNEGELLPLDADKIGTLAVIGPNAADLHLGGYSSDPRTGVSPLQGIRDRIGDRIRVLYAEGCRLTEGVQGWAAWWQNEIHLSNPADDEARIEEAVRVAKQADIVILMLGENESLCREGWSEKHVGDRDSLELPGRQNELVDAILQTGKPVVVLLFNGRPLSITRIAAKVPAILECWYLGQETGPAVADLLFGEASPGGRLPLTVPRSVGQVPFFYYHKTIAHRGYVGAEKTPLFPFGHGLTYTNFTYGPPRLNSERMRADETATLSVEVTNSGKRAGEEVVQLYVRDLLSEQVTRPVKLLKGFERISLETGERRTVSFQIGRSELEFLGQDLNYVVEPGRFELMVGGSSATTQSVFLELT